jgi:hypothetical protein
MLIRKMRWYISPGETPAVSKIISYATLVRQQHLNFLRHKSREYREREDYLARLRRLLFQVEAQMRQAELQQLEVFREMAAHFNVTLKFPDMGDRLGLQDYFTSNPFLVALKEFFAGRIPAEECCDKILTLQEPR